MGRKPGNKQPAENAASSKPNDASPECRGTAPTCAEDMREPATTWWTGLADDDPITLDALRDLPYPPFGLSSSIEVGPQGVESYFDPVALASYLTRKAVFENPLTRVPLSRDDCTRLDTHLGQLVRGSRNFRVADAWDLHRTIRTNQALRGGSQPARQSSVREATAAIHGLFDFSRRADSALNSSAAVNATGALSVVDDDMSRHQEADAIAARYTQGLARSEGRTPADLSDGGHFPAMPGRGTASEYVAAGRAPREAFVEIARTTAAMLEFERAERLLDESSRREAAKEARQQAATSKAAQVEATIAASRQREQRLAEAKADAAKLLVERHTAENQAWQEAEVATQLAHQAAAHATQADRVAAAELVKLEQRIAEEEAAEAAVKGAEDVKLRAEEKKIRDADKKRRAREKVKLKKQEAKTNDAAERAASELECAKLASIVKCGGCGDGIVVGGSAPVFEVMGLKFCGTACVAKFRRSSG